MSEHKILATSKSPTPQQENNPMLLTPKIYCKVSALKTSAKEDTVELLILQAFLEIVYVVSYLAHAV